MAVTGVWLAPGGGAAAALAGAVAVTAVGATGVAGGADSEAAGVSGSLAGVSGAAAGASSVRFPGASSAMDSIAGCARAACAVVTFFLKTGFFRGDAARGAGAAGGATVSGGVGGVGGKAMLRVSNAATRGDAGAVCGPMWAGCVCSSAACTPSTPSASTAKMRPGGAARGVAEAVKASDGMRAQSGVD